MLIFAFFTFVFIFPRIAKWINTFASACACSTSCFLALLDVLLNHFLVCDTLSEILLVLRGFLLLLRFVHCFLSTNCMIPTAAVNNLLGRCGVYFVFCHPFLVTLFTSLRFLLFMRIFVPLSWGFHNFIMSNEPCGNVRCHEVKPC